MLFVMIPRSEEGSAIGANVQMQIYRIVQEALNNICRHFRREPCRRCVSCYGNQRISHY